MVKNSGLKKETGFVVEKIVDKRITVDGKVEYCIKWRGYPNSENTWEPEENCNCPAIIQRFEESRAKSKKRCFEKKPKFEEIRKPRGYDRGLDMEEIVGAASVKEDVFYLVKWHSCNEFDLVDGAEVRLKNPETVIAFYEKRSPFQRNINQRLALVRNLHHKLIASEDLNASKDIFINTPTSSMADTDTSATTNNLLKDAEVILSDTNSATALNIGQLASSDINMQTNANVKLDVENPHKSPISK